MLKALGGENGDTVRVIREGHWAVGWVEWIAIDQEDGKALAIADELVAGLKDYPVIDEAAYSELEFNEMLELWGGMDKRERACEIMREVKRHHWVKPSLMRFRKLLKDDYTPGVEDGLDDEQAMVSRALEETMRYSN